MLKKACIISAIIVGVAAMAAANTDIPRMTVDQLKELLDDPKLAVIIIDVRTGSSWTKSKVMIKSAIREDPENFATWAKKYPQKNTIVLYCT